jgi:hypothetical protein
MMKRTSLVLLLLCAVGLSATNYYVDCNSAGGNGTTNALSGTNAAWNTIGSSNNSTALVAGDTINLARGCTWTDTIKPKVVGLTYKPYGTGTIPTVIGYSGYAINNQTGMNNTQYRDLRIKGQALITASTGVVLVNVLSNGRTSTNSIGMSIVTGSTVSLIGTAVVGYATYGISADSTSRVTLRNSIVFANGYGSNGAYGGAGISTSSGTMIDYDYSYIAANGKAANTNKLGSGTFTDGGHNLTGEQAIGVVHKELTTASPVFLLSVDGDNANQLSYYQQLKSLLPSSVKFTVFLTYLESIPTADRSGLLALTQDGRVDFGNHSYSHSALNATYLVRIGRGTNADGTLTVSNSSKTVSLTTSTGSGANDCSVNWSAGRKSITDLQTACAGKGWTFAMSSSPIVNSGVSLDALADATATITSTYDALPDATRYIVSEIGDAQTWITNNIGYTPSIVVPGQGTGTTAETNWLAANSSIYRGQRAAGGGAADLGNITIYSLSCNNLGTGFLNGVSQTDEAAVRRAADHIYLLMSTIGGLQNFFWHTSSDVSNQAVVWFVDQILKDGGSFGLIKDAVEAIRADHEEGG